MKKNMGTLDKGIRVILAAVFAYLYFSGTVVGTLGYVLLAFGVIFLLTSLVSFFTRFIHYWGSIHVKQNNPSICVF